MDAAAAATTAGDYAAVTALVCCRCYHCCRSCWCYYRC